MPTVPPAVVTVTITEFVEPRDRGEICVTLGRELIARKSNIALYGTNTDELAAFVVEKLSRHAESRGAELRFENVAEALVAKIRDGLGRG